MANPGVLEGAISNSRKPTNMERGLGHPPPPDWLIGIIPEFQREWEPINPQTIKHRDNTIGRGGKTHRLVKGKVLPEFPHMPGSPTNGHGKTRIMVENNKK
jgi:hypothetical protein